MVEEGSKLASDLLRLVLSPKRLSEKRKEQELALQADAHAPQGPPQPIPARPEKRIELPTTAETVAELRRRLGKELYRMELDLASGGRIAGKPCDCLGAKHLLGLEATAEELMAMDPNPVHKAIIAWLRGHQEEFDPAGIAERPAEYYQGLIPDVRRFRKEVMGTERLVALLDPQETQEVPSQAQAAAARKP